jgi:hypothetical protein
MSWNGRFWRLADSRRTPSQFDRSTRDVDALLAKVTAESWGPPEALPASEARQRIAEQKARDYGLGGLF